MKKPSQITLATIEVYVLLFSLSAVLLIQIHNAQPKPYMDEIFHIRQTMQYCEGRFRQWDPMITTLPGLYAISVVLLKVLSFFSYMDIMSICQPFYLRCVNVLFCAGNAVLLRLLNGQLHPVKEGDDQSSQKWRLLFSSVTMAMFPPLYFFTFLYYTDAGSTFFVLLMYYLSLRHRYTVSALCGLVAICFRQTNIIWLAFAAGNALSEILVDMVRPEKKDLTEEETGSLAFIPLVLRSLFANLRRPSSLKSVLGSVWERCGSYFLVALLFLTFVFWNDGIVVGDRASHQACFHAPQLLYFLAFTGGFNCMYYITFYKIVDFFKLILKHPFRFGFMVVLFIMFVRYFTYEHPYLLADNRHYTFYIWSRIFRRYHAAKYALIPGYLFACYTMFNLLKHKNVLWQCAFFICLLCATVPQKLLEFRYFIIPFLVFRLNMKPSMTLLQLFLEVSLVVLVNGLTIYYFLEKSFLWKDSPDTQRFMW